jgi:hypothetical protein
LVEGALWGRFGVEKGALFQAFKTTNQYPIIPYASTILLPTLFFHPPGPQTPSFFGCSGQLAKWSLTIPTACIIA